MVIQRDGSFICTTFHGHGLQITAAEMSGCYAGGYVRHVDEMADAGDDDNKHIDPPSSVCIDVRDAARAAGEDCDEHRDNREREQEREREQKRRPSSQGGEEALECLQRASQQPDMLDALMLCERYFGQGISSWFMRTVSAFRVRPALESKISWSRILDDDGHSAEMLTDSRCTVWKRILFIFPFVAIAIPYPYFVYIVPGLISENEAASFFPSCF